MADNHSGPPATPEQVGKLAGWFKDAFREFQLSWQLLFDPDVPMSSKVIPLLTAAYFIMPVDLLPDLALGLGQLDDLAIILIGLKLFVDVCPPDIVEKHRATIEGRVFQSPAASAGSTVIDVEPEVPDEEEPGTTPEEPL